MSEMTARDHALRVAVLKIISDETGKAYKGARGEAEECFAPLRDDGQSQQKALLPDGTDIGLLSIREGAPEVTGLDGGDLGKAVEAWADEHLPGAWEEYVNERDANSAEVLDVLRAVFPHLIGRRIRPATRAALVKEIEQSGGYLVDQVTGDKVKVGDVTDAKASGAFSFRPSPDARDRVIAAWRRGELREIALGALALPAGGDGE